MALNYFKRKVGTVCNSNYKKFIFEEEKFGLPKPDVDLDDIYFEVSVVNYISPSNFTIMPRHHLEGLKELMTRMANFYSDSPEQSVTWKAGDLCVAKDDCGAWLRGHIASLA